MDVSWVKLSFFEKDVRSAQHIAASVCVAILVLSGNTQCSQLCESDLPELTWPSVTSPGPSRYSRQIQDINDRLKAARIVSNGVFLLSKLAKINPVADIIASLMNLAINEIQADLRDSKLKHEIGHQIVTSVETIALGELKAKLTVLSKKMNYFLDPTEDVIHRKSNFNIALDKCQEMLILFSDPDYTYLKNTVKFSSHFQIFSTIYGVLGKIGKAQELGIVGTSRGRNLKKEMEKLFHILIVYQNNAASARGNLIQLYDDVKYYKKMCDKKDTDEIRSGQKPFGCRVTSCAIGKKNPSGKSTIWDHLKVFFGNKKPLKVFIDRVTLQTFCGWDDCLGNLRRFYFNKVLSSFAPVIENIAAVLQEYKDEMSGTVSWIAEQSTQNSVTEIRAYGINNYHKSNEASCRNGYCMVKCSLGNLNWCGDAAGNYLSCQNYVCSDVCENSCN